MNNAHEKMVEGMLEYLIRLTMKECRILSESDKEDALNTYSTTMLVFKNALKDEYKPLFDGVIMRINVELKLSIEEEEKRNEC